jgi:uncharacterized protein (DUF2252 family)
MRLRLAASVFFALAACAAPDDERTADEDLKASAAWVPVEGAAREAILVEELTRANAWIDPAVRAEKLDAMARSPFVFFRGTAHLYYRDLADGGRRWERSRFASPAAVTWVSGDLHTENFGAVEGPGGVAVYDTNDFDEAYVAGYLLDVWRLATSIVLVAEENGGFSPKQIEDAVSAMVDGYVDALGRFADGASARTAAITKDNAFGVLDEMLAKTEARASREATLDGFTTVDGAERRFRLDSARLAAVTEEERAALTAAIDAYGAASVRPPLRGDARYFRVLDVAKRLAAGTGSLGTARYYVLVDGPSAATGDDRILDVKAQGAPAFVPYLAKGDRRAYEARFPESESGCRVAFAERAMSSAPDPHAGCLSALGASFSVRERSPFRATLDTRTLTSATRLGKLAEQWGAVTAAAHARADGAGFAAEVVAIVSPRRERFRAEVTALALAYASQVATDHALFLSARAAGLLR